MIRSIFQHELSLSQIKAIEEELQTPVSEDRIDKGKRNMAIRALEELKRDVAEYEDNKRRTGRTEFRAQSAVQQPVDPILPFGKHRGSRASAVDREYLVWLQENVELREPFKAQLAKFLEL